VDKISIFAVLKQWLLQQRQTEASFVYILFAILLGKMIINGFQNGDPLHF